MRRELIVKTRGMAGSSDLTLLAPIRPGLIPSLESVTYKTRVKRLLTALNIGRTSAHEYSLLRAFSDAVERVGRIHSVRVAVIEPQDLVLLAVTFDGPWDSYIRVLWQKVGALLDVIFCNTVAPDGTPYVAAYDNTFQAWLGWARRVQIETAFFYGTPAITVDDVRYLKRDEWLHREHPPEPATDLAAARYALPPVENMAWETVSHGVPEAIGEAAKMGFQTLAGLYRLTDLYPPREDDGKYLHRASRELLLEFLHMLDEHLLDIALELVGKRFEKQLDWFKVKPSEPHGAKPPVLGDPPAYDQEDVQGGILHGYPGVTHGCLLFLAFDDPAALADFLEAIIPQLTPSSTRPQPGDLVRNLAFTYEGLRVAGLSEAHLAWFPQEFREGMEARAGILGDYRINHPRRWRLPVRNWPAPADQEPERIELSAVHAVLQLRVGTKDEAKLGIDEVSNPGHPLHAEVKRLERGWGKRARLLAIQPMRRYERGGEPVEHFGFVDGISQPQIERPKSGTGYSDQVHLGEILVGYANEADPAPADSAQAAFLHNGSFLVMRKLYQDVEALDVAVAGAARASGMQTGDILAKMMGRHLDGMPLVPSADQRNDFDYRLDPQGRRCPFHSHIRRANPRGQPMKDPPEQPGRRTPRLMRRGMSYGPRYNRNPANDEERAVNARERGVLFMAYNASIAEQFELVQRWISGGNSTGGFSGQSDPFAGVAANKLPRVFRFENDDGATVRVTMDGWDGLVEEPRPIVRLDWGAYLFTPSFHAMQEMHKIAGGAPAVTPVWSVEDGENHINALLATQDVAAAKDAWKTALEDSESQRTYVSASIWAAIRDRRHGALCTPYGVLVARHDLVMKVLGDGRTYSVDGPGDSYRARMDSSIGEIYLGYDESNPEYAKQSAAANGAIGRITEDDAFKVAREATDAALFELKEQAYAQAQAAGHQRWELTVDLREILDKVFATLCDYWFGVLETGKKRFLRGGTRGDWKPEEQPPFYPGNFTAPSRYIFQPHPGTTVIKFGREYGVALTKAMKLWIGDHRVAGTRPQDPDGNPAPVGDAIFGPAGNPTPTDLAAQTLVGVMMGFLPPADGNLRLTMNEWLRDGTFWSLRARNGRKDLATYQDAMTLMKTELYRAMQLRPSPELVWRRAAQGHDLDLGKGNRLSIKQGEMVVVSIVSATQQCLASGSDEVYPIFGGNRAAPVHPTHACPAYKAAFGVIAGVIGGLLARKESVRPGIAPGALVFEGPMPPKPPADLAAQAAKRQEARKLPAVSPKCRLFSFFIRNAPRLRARDATKVLLSWGDSWFHYKSNSAGTTNITKYLLSQKYEFPVLPLGGNGAWLSEMAADPSEFLLELKNMIDSNVPPRAILLSGGGNDVVKTTLATMLNNAPSQDPINGNAIRAKIDVELRAHYVTILTQINALTAGTGRTVPVLVHPYCYPIPDGRISPSWPESFLSWLYPSITTEKRYRKFEDGVPIMKRVIDRFDVMQKSLTTDFGNVHVVPSVKVLDPFVWPGSYTDVWENELHPNIRGFSLIGKEFANTIAALP